MGAQADQQGNERGVGWGWGESVSCVAVLLKGHDGTHDVPSPLDQALELGLKEGCLSGRGTHIPSPAGLIIHHAFLGLATGTAPRPFCVYQSSARFSEATWAWEWVAGGDWFCFCGATELVLGAVPSPLALPESQAAQIKPRDFG